MIDESVPTVATSTCPLGMGDSLGLRGLISFSLALLGYCDDHFTRTVKPPEQEPLGHPHFFYPIVRSITLCSPGSLALTLISPAVTLPTLEAVCREHG